MAFDTSYTYDPVGNRLTKTDNLASATTTYKYDAGNQLETSVDSSGTTTYKYDDSGNLTAIQAPGNQDTSYTWDDENRRTKVETPAGAVVTNVYNGDGLRVEKKEPTATKRYVWDEQNYLLETDENDVTQVRYTQDPQAYGRLISQRRGTGAGPETEWFHFDAQGSTVNVTDGSELVIESYAYDAWGELVSANSFLPAFLFVGESGYYYDPISEDYYVRARVYQPSLARWSSQDPLGVFEGSNLLIYVRNNPTTLIDPSGALSQQTAPRPGGRPNPQTGPGVAISWRTKWQLGADEKEGWIIQCVAARMDARTCADRPVRLKELEGRTFGKCESKQYCELWSVATNKRGRTGIRGAWGRRPRANEGFDDFALIGRLRKSRCKFCYGQMGIAWFYPSTEKRHAADQDMFMRLGFAQANVAAAGKLPAVCIKRDQQLLNIFRKLNLVTGKGKNTKVRAPATAKIMISQFDSCPPKDRKPRPPEPQDRFFYKIGSLAQVIATQNSFLVPKDKAGKDYKCKFKLHPFFSE